MIAQMNVIQNAARMAMADHRAADPRFLRRRASNPDAVYPSLLIAAAGAILAACLWLLA